MRRYNAPEKRRLQNRMFGDNEEAFYELIIHVINYSEGLPGIDYITNFSAQIWETPETNNASDSQRKL